MARASAVTSIPLKSVSTILKFSEHGASLRTASHYFGDGMQIQQLMQRSRGRPKTSYLWFNEPKNSFEANVLVDLYCKRWSLDKALRYGIGAEELVAVYESYLVVTSPDNAMSFDRAFNVFSKLRDGSLLSVKCGSCKHSFVRLDRRQIEDCPFCILTS